MKKQPIETAPKTAVEIILFVPKKGWPSEYRVIGHWADGGGDEQPRFKGWFRDTGCGFSEIGGEPTHWAPLPKLEEHNQ